MHANQADVYQFVSFEIAGEEFGVDILTVQEVIRVVDITCVPGAPAFIEGLMTPVSLNPRAWTWRNTRQGTRTSTQRQKFT